jgi:parvulin-like peptidyl-prolyl isomerase
VRSSHLRVASLAAAALALAAAPGSTSSPQLPVVKGQKALASVDGEPVAWVAFADALSSVHEGAAEDTKRAKQDPQALLERLITGKLVAQEARNIGLDQDPKYKAAVASFRIDTMQKTLLEREADRVQAPDPDDVQARFRMLSSVARIDSILFTERADADALATAVAGGKDFGAGVKDAAAAGKARSDSGVEVKLAEMQPEIANAVKGLKPGQISSVIQVKDGFTVVRLVELKTPDDPAVMAKARQDALEWKRLQAVKSYTSGLTKRYAKIDQKAIDALDFDAGAPELIAAKTDARVAVTIQGGSSITVGDIATDVEKNFFHGTERAAKEKRLNVQKLKSLDDLLLRKLIAVEGPRAGVDKTAEFQQQLREYEDGLLFSAFLTKVITPDLKLDEKDVRAYYDAHVAHFTSPAMLRLDSIAFTDRKSAEETLVKTRNGADFGWLKQNASGQAKGDDAMQLGGGVYLVDNVDPGMRKVLADPKPGDARLFATDGAIAYVIQIREVIPSKTEPFEQAKADAGRQVLNDTTKRVLDDWSAKLRKAYEVKTFVTPAQLDALVAKEFGRKA